jgi:type IV secretion system protein VirB11
MVEFDPTERVFIIEDTGEIQCTAKNFVQYHTSPEVSMTALLKITLRMRPNRILVGEVRGPEALDLLMAWNTGHEGGAATLHANNARAGLDRLAMLISMHPDSPKPIEPLIGEAVHVVVHIARTQEGRRVQEIIEVSGYKDGQYIFNQL